MVNYLLVLTFTYVFHVKNMDKHLSQEHYLIQLVLSVVNQRMVFVTRDKKRINKERQKQSSGFRQVILCYLDRRGSRCGRRGCVNKNNKPQRQHVRRYTECPSLTGEKLSELQLSNLQSGNKICPAHQRLWILNYLIIINALSKHTALLLISSQHRDDSCKEYKFLLFRVPVIQQFTIWL